MVHYWLDPVWKEFNNMSNALLCLDAIPDEKRSDGDVEIYNLNSIRVYSDPLN